MCTLPCLTLIFLAAALLPYTCSQDSAINLLPMEDFDVAEIMGEWHSKMAQVFSGRTVACLHATVTRVNDTSFKIHLAIKKNGEKSKVDPKTNPKADLIYTEKSRGVYQAYDNDETRTITIVSTDYVNYMIVVVTANGQLTLVSVDGRKTEPLFTNDVLVTVLNVMSQLNLDSSKFVVTNSSVIC